MQLPKLWVKRCKHGMLEHQCSICRNPTIKIDKPGKSGIGRLRCDMRQTIWRKELTP